MPLILWGVSQRFSGLRSVLEYEYRPKYWFSHLKYINSLGRGQITDWDGIVITYVDEEYREFMKKEMEKDLETETLNFHGMKFLLLRDIKVGDNMGKSMVELEEYGNKLKKDVYCDETGCYLLRDVKVDDTFGKTFSVVKALLKSVATVLELFRKCCVCCPQCNRRYNSVGNSNKSKCRHNLRRSSIYYITKWKYLASYYITYAIGQRL